jgi:hypothetical protein
MYEHPSTTEKLKIIKQKHDESLQDYVKYFYNARNAILNIQDIKTVEQITMKKPKTMADMLVVTHVWIEASETGVWLLDSRNKGMAKKK